MTQWVGEGSRSRIDFHLLQWFRRNKKLIDESNIEFNFSSFAAL